VGVVGLRGELLGVADDLDAGLAVDGILGHFGEVRPVAITGGARRRGFAAGVGGLGQMGDENDFGRIGCRVAVRIARGDALVLALIDRYLRTNHPQIIGEHARPGHCRGVRESRQRYCRDDSEQQHDDQDFD